MFEPKQRVGHIISDWQGGYRAESFQKKIALFASRTRDLSAIFFLKL